MYIKSAKGFWKHLDFAIIDVFSLYLSFFIVYVIRCKGLTGFDSSLNLRVLELYFFAEVSCTLITKRYNGVVKRNNSQTLFACIKYNLLVTLLAVFLFFLFQISSDESRLQIGFTYLLTIVISFLFFTLHKRTVRKRPIGKEASRLLIVTTSEVVGDVVQQMEKFKGAFKYHIAGLCVVDKPMVGETLNGVPVVADKESVLLYACRNWVDEVFFDFGTEYAKVDPELLAGFLEMGITTHSKLYRKDNSYSWEKTVGNLGPYLVLTRNIRMVSYWEQLGKRVVDFLGGLVGTLITCILFLFIAPIIKIKSPGPVIFKQERIGQNGRRFKMYKFRSMVMNADELKAKYMAQNRVQDGMMFKLDWDPRIIGNVELPDGTRKTGIGEFLRKTSLDEFPQFINVLKGEMSLVGTRPPTVDEWDKYELHHRARMAVKPGITGLWQISGRSEITDFEEVVRLDREYISKWSFSLDLRILLGTFSAVLKRKGSM